MKGRTVSTLLIVWSLIVFLWLGSQNLKSAQYEPAKVRVDIVQIERVNQAEVHFRLKLVNESRESVFVEGSKFDSPIP